MQQQRLHKFAETGILLKYDGGARKTAEMLELQDWHAADALVRRIQRVCSGYRMCDLACWLCLAHQSVAEKCRANKKHKR